MQFARMKRIPAERLEQATNAFSLDASSLGRSSSSGAWAMHQSPLANFVRAIKAAALVILMTGFTSGDVLAGAMIVSDTNPGLAVNAYGGAANGTILRLVGNCTATNPDCTWAYLKGMLVSDRDPSLAIVADGSAANGAALKLMNGCSASKPECTWTFRRGMLISDANPSLAVNAYGGAASGTVLRLVANCPPGNSDCTWTYRRAMLFSDTQSGLAVNAYGGAREGTVPKLVNNCPPDNGDCTWTYKKGLVYSDTDPGLAMNAYGGARDGTELKLVRNCPPGNSDCTFTFSKGMVLSDTNPGLAVNAYGGAKEGTALKLVSNCPPGNPDCTWSVKLPPAISAIRFEFAKTVAGTLPVKASPGRTRVLSDGSVDARSEQGLAGVPDRMWSPGQTLKVRMSGGSAFVRSKTRQFAEEWTKYANIRFSFVDDSQAADIRVDFGSDGASWSLVGRDALLVPFDFATMHYGWFDDSTPDSEFSRVVVHEFGHALGLIHEHQSPAAGIQWNKEKVYAFFNAMTPPWDRGMVDSQVFDTYRVSSTNFSQFDPASIMEYSFPASLTLNGVGVPGNTSLSGTDKQFIALWYPFPGADQGQLRTGDDCDEINFRVDYGVENEDKVRFVLRPGSTVRWWKSIEVPSGPGQYTELQIQDGASSDRSVDKLILDGSRPIRFSKAKFAGAHTLLGYRWDVISALPGGSRVTLDWVNDTCH